MRTICVVVGSRANYSSIKSVMRAVKAHKELTLQVVVTASALLDRYGAVVEIITRDGFTPDDKIHTLVEGETPLTMAQSTGLGLIEMARTFDRLRPDVVVTVGDRFETMATAVAAAYMNIPLAHTMGGEITGTIDESIRHAVTKLAHIHFPANKGAAERIIKMGEEPAHVHAVGCPRMDLVAEVAAKHPTTAQMDYINKEGVGAIIDLTKPYLLVMQHPVTTEYGSSEDQISSTLKAIEDMNMQTVMMWPNADAGSEDISRGMRKFREQKRDKNVRFIKNLPVEQFIPLMVHCACMIGNSSAAIREGSFLGVPAVNVGTRQAGRDRSQNIVDVKYDATDIVAAIKKQVAHGHYGNDGMYGDGHAGVRIADILATCPLSVQKQITY